MNIQPGWGWENSWFLAVQSFPQLRSVSQALILAVGMRVPASERWRLGVSQEGRAMPIHFRRTHHEKTFGPGRAVPLDRNAKARIMAYARRWSADHTEPGQHKGPITRAFLEVLEALLWGFHNARSGCCFPSYE